MDQNFGSQTEENKHSQNQAADSADSKDPIGLSTSFLINLPPPNLPPRKALVSAQAPAPCTFMHQTISFKCENLKRFVFDVN